MILQDLIMTLTGKPYLLLIASVSIIVKCGLNIEDPTPPSTPQWVQKSTPEQWPERGIDAHESGGIYLEWEAYPFDESIDEYLIYRAEYFEFADSIGNFDLIWRANIPSMAGNEHIDRDVQENTTYYYKMKAKDISQNTSAFSDSLEYTLLPQINTATLSPNGLFQELNASRALSWNFFYDITVEKFCVTILSNTNEFVARQLLVPANYHGGNEVWIIPIDVYLSPEVTYKWRVDMCANFRGGLEMTGSESVWATFIFKE